MSDTRRRVKLFFLNEERQWDDHGTGHVSAMFTDHENESNGIVLLVRSEEDGKVLLESRIQTDTFYQRQQDTLVVWSEADKDIALSFQEEEGCNEIWEKICQVQGRDPNQVNDGEEEDEQQQFEEMTEYSPPIELPKCEISKLDEICELCHGVLPSPIGREKLATAVEHENYIPQLIDLFHMCEDLENTEGLHSLYDIFKSLFMLEKNSLFEIMFTADRIIDVIGILEYDPSKKEPTRHRSFLQEKAKFKEVLPMENKELVQKIHLAYRVQYIKDILVPVPSLFEENMSTLSSFLFFSKIEIVNLIQEDDWFLTELFNKLTDDEISDDKRKEIVLFLKELCTLSQTLQQENREAFLKVLTEHGLLSTLETLLNFDDVGMKAAIVDILCCIVEFNPSSVRDYLIREANTIDEDSILMNMLIDQLICNADTGMGILLVCLIKTLLDPENMGLGTNKMEKSQFLSFFYRHCMHILTAPLFAVTGTNELEGKDDFKSATVLDYIIELLSFCVDHHIYHIKNYILTKDLLRRVLTLMKSRHKFLSLAALRFARKIVGIKDEFYNLYIIKGKLLGPVVDAFVDNGEKYNLLNSAIIELFEFIRLEDIKSLCAYVVENHIEPFTKIDYVGTFRGLQLRYEQEKDRVKKNNQERNANHGIIHSAATRKRRDDRSMDEDEENWFDSEEDDLADSSSGSSPSDSPLTKPITAKLKDVDLIDSIPVLRTESPPFGKSANAPANRVVSPPGKAGAAAPPRTATVGKSESTTGKAAVNSKHASAVANHKPAMNIKINSSPSSGLVSSSIVPETLHDTPAKLSELPNVNGDALSKPDSLTSNATNLTILTSKKAIVDGSSKSPTIGFQIKAKSLPLGGLVDYPDDDDEDEENGVDSEIPMSPAKKQRLSST